MPATLTHSTTSLTETVATGGRVDRAAGIIRDVRVLGRSSSNGREYTSDAVQAAVPLYEGASVNIDHPAKPQESRGVTSRFGELRNVRFERGGLTGDLHYLKSHPLAEMVVECAERMPGKLGLSHNVEGRTSRSHGTLIVEEIVKVRSVDLVADPATTKGLFESRSGYPATYQEFIRSLHRSRRRPFTESLSGIASGGSRDFPPGPGVDGFPGESAHAKARATFAKKLLGVLAGFGSPEQKLAKLVQELQAVASAAMAESMNHGRRVRFAQPRRHLMESERESTDLQQELRRILDSDLDDTIKLNKIRALLEPVAEPLDSVPVAESVSVSVSSFAPGAALLRELKRA